MNSSLLENWAAKNRENLGYIGVSFELVVDSNNTSTAQAIDFFKQKIGGRVCYWPTGIFEFQFHDITTGNIVHLEEKSMDIDDLYCYLNSLFKSLD